MYIYIYITHIQNVTNRYYGSIGSPLKGAPGRPSAGPVTIKEGQTWSADGAWYV